MAFSYMLANVTNNPIFAKNSSILNKNATFFAGRKYFKNHNSGPSSNSVFKPLPQNVDHYRAPTVGCMNQLSKTIQPLVLRSWVTKPATSIASKISLVSYSKQFFYFACNDSIAFNNTTLLYVATLLLTTTLTVTTL
jgi:hypothetical protein